MTYYVSSGMLNPTHSLKDWLAKNRNKKEAKTNDTSNTQGLPSGILKTAVKYKALE